MTAIDRRDVVVPATVRGLATQIAATLSVPSGARVLQVLVHGFTYDRRYWDFPYLPEHHSYVRRANAAGYATLAIDRLGTGLSGRPPGRRLTWATAADTVAQVISAARAGKLAHDFQRLILVGHSYGSVTSYRVADRYAGVDALIATGISHRVSIPALTTNLVVRCRPLPPESPLDAPDRFYVSTVPGARQQAFQLTSADPELLRIDEELKQPAGALELPTALAYLLPGTSKHTNIPVLTVNGSLDKLFPGTWTSAPDPNAALRSAERPFYGPNAVVEAAVILETGHCLTLEPKAGVSFDRMLDFCDRHCPS